MDAVRQYIIESNTKGHARGLNLFNRIPFQVTSNYPSNINLASVIARIERTLPEWIFGGIEEVFVGPFKSLKEREVNSVYEDDAIYLLNERDTDDHVFDDILHEASHALEKQFEEFLYGDNKLRNEFVAKKAKLAEYLKHDQIHMPSSYVGETEFSEEIDDFLVNEIGYDKLSGYTKDLFLNPYAITSLSEYVAVGFEKYFSGINQDRTNVQSITPAIYRKLKEIEAKHAA